MVGRHALLGYDVDPRGFRLLVNEDEAVRVRAIFDLYLQHQALLPVVQVLAERGWLTKRWVTRASHERGGGERRSNRKVPRGPFPKGRSQAHTVRSGLPERMARMMKK